MPQVQGWSVDGFCSPRSGVTNDMACSSSVIFRWRQLIRAPQVAQRIEEGLIFVRGAAREHYRKLLRTCAAQPPTW